MQKRPKLHDTKITRKFVTTRESAKHAVRNAYPLLNLNFELFHWENGK